MSAKEANTLPDPKEIAKTYAEVAERASHLITDHVKRQMKRGVSVPSDDLGIAQAFMDMMAKMLANPYKLAQAQMNLVWDYFSLWQHSTLRMMGMQGAPVAEPKKGDKRFADAEWEEHFLFDFIKQSYLITARHIHDSVSNVEDLDENSRKKVNFFTRQFIDALAPSNFAVTNPEVLRETVKSHGQNLLKGFNNLLRDIEEGGGQLRVKMTDPSAFEMGKNVASTPGKVIFQNEMIQLLQFSPTTKEQFKRPLLIIPPWINKYYILDLRESNSWIKWCTDQGHSVFVISWVNPDAKLAAKKDKRIASATFFVALLDFSVPGELGVFIDEGQVASLEKKMEERGYLEGSEMGTTFNMLRSNDLIWTFVVNNYLMGKEPFPFDLLYWNSDSTRMPYKMHSYYLRNMYMKNLLRVPGGITLLDTPIDISKVKTPCYFISTIEDHIAPWRSVYLGSTVLGGPVRFVLGGSGHIAGIVNPPSANKYGFWINDKRPDTPDEWFAGAKQNEGSWWTDWQKWITNLNDEKVPARDPAKGKFKALEDAPGSFVKFRLDASKTRK